MEEYAHRKNIERFERDLADQTLDAAARVRLQALLAAERKHLARVLQEKRPAGI